jgi:hypothetical protein
LSFTECRQNTQFSNLVWSASEKRLSLTVAPPAPQRSDLTILIPVQHDGARLVGVEQGQRSVPLQYQTVGGIRYASVPQPATQTVITAHYL